MIKVGKYVSTHGIKGEIKLISDFSRKDLIFIKGSKIYIDNKEYIIESYRKHKKYDMLTLENINNINDIINLKGSSVYINKTDFNIPFIEEDLLDYQVSILNNKYKIKNIINNYKQKLLVLENDKKIPFVDEFVKKIDENDKIIYMEIPNGLL